MIYSVICEITLRESGETNIAAGNAMDAPRISDRAHLKINPSPNPEVIAVIANDMIVPMPTAMNSAKRTGVNFFGILRIFGIFSFQH